MGVAQWRIWQIGIFKTAGFLISTPAITIDLLKIREEGTIGIEKTPLKTGYTRSKKEKRAWHALHSRMVRMTGRELPLLPVSERNRIPLDPYNTSKDTMNIEAINFIAANSYNEAFSRLKDTKAESDNAKMARAVFYGVLILALGVFLIHC